MPAGKKEEVPSSKSLTLLSFKFHWSIIGRNLAHFKKTNIFAQHSKADLQSSLIDLDLKY